MKMNHCLVKYEVGSGGFGVVKECVVSTDGEIWPAIQAAFAGNWGEDTIQHEGDMYRWFNKDEDEYIRIENMNMIDDTDAYVLKKYIQSHTHEPQSEEDFAQMMLEADDEVVMRFTGQSLEDIHDHESQGTLGDIIAEAYENTSAQDIEKFKKELTSNGSL